MYTKYHQNISYGIRVIECTSFPQYSSFKRVNTKGQKGGATCYTYISIIYYLTCNSIPQVAGVFNKYLPVNSVQLI